MRRWRLPQTWMGWTQAGSTVVAWAVILAMAAYVLWPTFANPRMHGIHDWDPQELFRYLVYKTIVRFHQFPFWNPYTCGGHPIWAGVESDSTIVSPFLPAYLFLPLGIALRVELVGSALLSIAGTWFFAGRWTKSPAVRAFVVVVFAINGRWTLQATAGHPWHYAYELTPWTLYFLDRAFSRATGVRSPSSDVFFAGASMALMVYVGGIYPLPQTAIIVLLYSAFYGTAIRDTRPVVCSLEAAIVAVVLSAPKLIPTLELFGRFPRLTDSPEWMDLSVFVAILTSPDQDFSSRPAAISHWGWHEWGMYIGLVPSLVLGIAAIVGRGDRLSALRWTAIVVILLGFGSFHRYAPWSLLHQVSIFRSQHVPSRWLYPGLLLALAVAALVLERAMTLSRRVRPLVEVAALVAVAWIARDVAKVARLPLVHMFTKPAPLAKESMQPFQLEYHMPPEIGYPSGGEWAPPSLPLAIANVGCTDCGTFFPFHNYYRDHLNHAPGLGARGRGEPGYRGDAYVVEGTGHADLASFTPNEMVVRVKGARAGDHVALNQNYDPGWLANEEAALKWGEVPAATLSSSDETVVFRYRPKTLWLGLSVFSIGLPLVVGAAWPKLGRRGVRRILRMLSRIPLARPRRPT
ncbi:MAG: hypothetical protein ABSC94_02120 [Polyangiaceae bacterium]